jgi:hypothetical protein
MLLVCIRAGQSNHTIAQQIARAGLLCVCRTSSIVVVGFTCDRSQGVCATCRKVVVLKTLEDPSKGATVCLALLSDESLLKSTLDIDDDEELEAVRGQIMFMMDSYFDKS